MIYWDTSALMRFFVTKRVREISGVTRTHTMAELFAALTGRGWLETLPGGVTRSRRLGAKLAARMVDEISGQLTFVELTRAEVQSAVDDASSLGVSGGRIHDLLHARAAEKSKAQEFWTCDENDFDRLTSVRIKLI